MVVAYRLNHYAEKSRRYSADGEAGEFRRAPRHEEVQAQPRRVDDALEIDVSRVSRRENARQRQREAEQVGDDDGAEDGEDVEIFILAHEAEEEDEDDDEQRDGPEVRRVELNGRRREREAYRHNRRADDHRSDYLAYAPDEPSVAERRERDAADDERAADVLHDDVGPHALVRADDGHNRRYEAEARALNDREPRAELRMRLNERRDAHAEVDAADEGSHLCGRHAHSRPEHERHERRRSEERKHVLRSRKNQNRQRRLIVDTVNKLLSRHDNSSLDNFAIGCKIYAARIIDDNRGNCQKERTRR